MKRITLLLAVAICMEQSITAQTNVSGYILSNTTWTQAGSPYLVTGNTLVASGVTLAIEPGVEVKFDSTRALQIDGELIAVGTAQSRITFTSSSQNPVKGSWGRIQFKNSSTDANLDTDGNYVSGSILKYCDILYGGGIGNTGAIDCDSSAPYFSHCRIWHSKTAGIYFNRSANRGIDSSSIKYCDKEALYYHYATASDLIIKNDTIEYTKGISAYSGTAPGSGYEYNYTFNNAYFYNNLFANNIDRAISITTRSCEIIGNAFISNSTESWYVYGRDGMILVDRTNYCLVSNNEFRSNVVVAAGNGYTGSMLHLTPYYYSSTAIISDNVFLSNSVTVVPFYNSASNSWILNATNANILNNYFEDNNNVLNIGNCHVQCNVFIQNQSVNGFHLFTGNSAVAHNLFENNVADSSRSLWGVQSGTAEFANNLFRNNSAPSGSIIVVPNFSSANIYNNDFVDNSGLSCLSISNNTAINNNNFQNPGMQYEINNLRLWGTPNIQANNNYWGTTNTAHIDSAINDFFDDAAYSVVFYLPILASPALVDTTCPLVICSLSVSGIIIPPSCFGGSNGSINITVSNGATPYTYVWSNGGNTQNRTNLAIGNYTVTVVDANLCSVTRTFTVSQPATPVAVSSAVITNANCNTGGSIQIAVSGGTSPYTYNWGSGITTQNHVGLNPGNYSVTVRDDNNCSVTQSFTVGQDAGPTISGVVTNTNCNNSCDGAINLAITGNAPFSFNWGNGFETSEDTSGLCAGTYNVTVADSNNCGIAASFTVTSPTALNASANITTPVSCFGFSDGVATASTNGGTAPYSFLWSDGQTAATATGLSAGTYDVTVTDSLGCAASASVSIPDGDNVFVGVIIGASNIGINQITNYSVNAIFNYSYTWNVVNGIILNGQGSNTIEVAWTTAGAGLVELIASAQGCADTVSKSVTVTDTTRNCSALFYLYPDIVPHSYFVVNTASGIAPLFYSWNWGDGSPADTAAYPSHTYSAPGFYTICLSITDSSGCTDTYCNPYFLLKTDDKSSAMIQVNVVPPTFTGIQNAEADNIIVFPNPTDGIITLRGSKAMPSLEGMTSVQINLLDAMGKSVLQHSMESALLSQGISFDISHFPKGLYFLRLQAASGFRMMKVMKN